MNQTDQKFHEQSQIIQNEIVERRSEDEKLDLKIENRITRYEYMQHLQDEQYIQEAIIRIEADIKYILKNMK